MLNLTTTGDILPYILLPPHNLKMLIDTGSTRSFLRHDTAQKFFKPYIHPEKFIVQTPHGKSIEEFATTIPTPKIFNMKGQMKFHLFNFHDYFDGLIGMNILKTFKLVPDTSKDVLINNHTQIKLLYKETGKTPENKSDPPFNLNKIKIPAETEKVIEIEIHNIQNGEAVIPQMTFENLIINEGISTVKDNKAFCSVINPTNNDLFFTQKKPLTVQPLSDFTTYDTHDTNTNFHYSHNTKPTDKTLAFDFSMIRSDHMNKEEKHALKQLLNSYADIFHIEGNRLTNTNKIKHVILTKDEVPVYTKSYRYPEVHKKEVSEQIQKMLDQGTNLLILRGAPQFGLYPKRWTLQVNKNGD